MNLKRRLPNSNITRQNALNAAVVQLAIEPGTLTAATQTRLTAMNSNYNNAQTNADGAKAAQTTCTEQKDAAVDNTRMFVSHFIQVFNLGVKRGKYPAGHRSYYDIDVSSEAVPNLDTESAVLHYANKIVTGDPLRISAGGAPMANPEMVEVQTSLNALTALKSQHNALSLANDAAEEAVEALNAEADKVIKKVWDEVETFYNEEAPASMRENARRWGVVYVTEGPAATLVGFVKNSANEPEAGRVVTLNETGATATTDATGRYQIETKITGEVTLRVHGPDDASGRQTVTIPEHEGPITINVPDILW